MNQHSDPVLDLFSTDARVTLRGPGELADALPYLVGFHPDDSIVLVALHGSQGRCGGRVRLGIPPDPAEWPEVAGRLAARLLSNAEAHETRPDGTLVYLCQDPPPDGDGRSVMERLRPLAQHLRTACGELEMPVHEALCVSGGRYWSYCCPGARCCAEEGHPMGLPGTSAMAAAAVYAGIQVRGSLKELEARFAPLGPPFAGPQLRALDAVAVELVPRLLLGAARKDDLCERTIDLAERLLERFTRVLAPPEGTASPEVTERRSQGPADDDARDDALLGPTEAAALIVGLQDRDARDRVAEWMEGQVAQPALRLWRAAARRCVGAYAEFAAPLLTLAGWVAWSSGDEPTARVAFGRALRADPQYLFAQLLHEACNEGLNPEVLRGHMRQARASRERSLAEGPS